MLYFLKRVDDIKNKKSTEKLKTLRSHSRNKDAIETLRDKWENLS